jgi:PBSX family phage terminase large subunit
VTVDPAAVVDTPVSPKQLAFLRESDGTVNILEGSIRAGKTFVSLLRWLIFLAFAPYGGELVMVGRTKDALFRNVIKPMQDPSLFGPLAALVVYTNGAPTATIFGRTVHVIGASDAKAEKVIRGMTVAGAYVDEVTVIPEEFFTQLLGRMSVRGAQLFGTTNPDSPAHWLKRKFLDRIDTLPGWRLWRFTMDDNPSLSEAYKRAKRAEFTGLWFRRFIQGDWVAAEGAVFDAWDPDQHVVPHDLLPPLSRLLAVGVDYGTTNPTAALLLGVTAEPVPRLAFVDEWRYQAGTMGQRWTDAQLSEGMRAWMGEWPDRFPGLPAPSRVFLDPAAASFNTQLRADGVKGLTAAENDVAYGLATVSSLIAKNRLIVSDRCAGWITEAPGYSWDEKATEKGQDKPIKVADHSLDAGRYAITTTERKWRALLRLTA